jgi:hypothetical protein
MTQPFDLENIPSHSFVLEASAGTGKTHSLVQIYLSWTLERGLDPLKLPVMTFTEDAAAEMRSRIGLELRKVLEASEIEPDGTSSQKRLRALGVLEDLPRAPIGTIHSFCFALLGRFPLEFGVNIPLEMAPKTIGKSSSKNTFGRTLSRGQWRSTMTGRGTVKTWRISFLASTRKAGAGGMLGRFFLPRNFCRLFQRTFWADLCGIRPFGKSLGRTVRAWGSIPLEATVVKKQRRMKKRGGCTSFFSGNAGTTSWDLMITTPKKARGMAKWTLTI